MGDKIALMKDGHLMQYDSPTNLLTNPKNEFVEQFVGQDRALKSLSLLTLSDLVNQVTLPPALTDSETQRVHSRTTVKDALSMILNQESNELTVVDGNNQPIGTIHMEHIQGYLASQNKNETPSSIGS